MPVSYRFEGRVIVVRAAGAYTTREMQETWEAVERDSAYAATTIKPGICIDLRESESLAKRQMGELRSLADWFMSHGPGTALACAFVVRPGVQFGLLRMMTTWFELRGSRALVATDLDQALTWLSGQPS